MQRHINSSSKFSRVNPVDIDLALSACDEYVLVARVDVEPGDLALVNNELSQRGLVQLRSPDVDLSHTHAVRGCRGYHSERALECRHPQCVRDVKAPAVRIERVAVHQVAILRVLLPVFDDLQLDLQLV